MEKKKIPVYDICSISREPGSSDELLVERLSTYLKKYYAQLHFPHRHSFYHMVLFMKGKGFHSIDFDKFSVKPYQVYCMVPGQVHSWNFEKEMEGYIINFSEDFFKSFLLNPSYVEQFSFFSGNSKEGVVQLPESVHKEIVKLAESLVQQRGVKHTDKERLLLLQLLMLVEESISHKGIKAIPQQKQLLLRNFRRLIEAHYKTMRLPNEYADLLYITSNHLNALCRDLLGKTAGEVIRDRVLLEAKRLLTNGAMSVAEIGYELNFQDNSYFNRFFKKSAGVTPEEFRRQFLIVK